jgi:hypothetical protein
MELGNTAAVTAVVASAAADPRQMVLVAAVWAVGGVVRRAIDHLTARRHEREHTLRVATALRGTKSRHRAGIVTACATLEAAGRGGGGPAQTGSKSGRNPVDPVNPPQLEGN